MLVLRFLRASVLFLIVFLNLSSSKSDNVDVCSLLTETWKTSGQLKELAYTNAKPAGGSEAGKYSKVKVNSWEECVAQCCQFSRCNAAYWISNICLHIECLSDELCQPTNAQNSEVNDEAFYLIIRSVQKTAAALDYDDPGRDECNATKSCAKNEHCEQVSINAQIQRNICVCDRDQGYRRINGVCRQYSSRSKPCALYEKDDDTNNDDDETDDSSAGKCRKNEECLPPNDRAKHGYCQCKLGFIRNEKNRCVVEKEAIVSTESSPTASPGFDLEIKAGDDQIIKLPTNQIDLYGHILFKSNQSEINGAELKSRNSTVSWTLKSSTNNVKVEMTNPDETMTHVLVKQLSEGSYEFELKVNDDQGRTIASDVVKVDVLPEKQATVPLLVKVTSPMSIRLPQQTIKLESHIEPSDRQVTYQWTYSKDGPVTPTLENTDGSDLSISNIRPGTYTFRLRVTDNLGNEQTKTVELIVTGEPIEARLTNSREIVFWPSTDVMLDGRASILEQQTDIRWSLLSNDNRQRVDEIEISSPHSLKTQISNLRIGQYRFQLKLTTSDEKYTSKKEVLVIVYAQNGQPPKIDVRIENENINILNNLIILNASGTTADYGIAKWQWIKSPLSPAMGHFINQSQQLPIAYVTNLIQGQYIFTLQVTDDRQQMSEVSVTVNVNGIPDAENLIEVDFIANPYLHQRTLENLLAQIRVFLIDAFPNINIVMIGMTKENLLLIKGIDTKSELTISPKAIVNHLQKKLKSLRAASNVNILSIDTYLCLSNCSNHGTCDQKTKHCTCQKYYMENWFKSIVYKEPNCDFLIHYFVLSVLAGAIVSIIFCWLCTCCCLRWKRRRNLIKRRERIRYRLLHENDDDDDGEQQLIQNRKQKKSNKSRSNKNTSVILSESDLSDEQTIYDKPLLAAKLHVNSSPNKHRDLKVPVQDSNGSPMLRLHGQSPTTNDQSVA